MIPPAEFSVSNMNMYVCSSASLDFAVPNCKQQVESEALTAGSTAIAFFWVVAPCCLVHVYQYFRSLTASIIQRPDDGGSKQTHTLHTALQPRKQLSLQVTQLMQQSHFNPSTKITIQRKVTSSLQVAS
jgi:hypothetical protein